MVLSVGEMVGDKVDIVFLKFIIYWEKIVNNKYIMREIFGKCYCI